MNTYEVTYKVTVVINADSEAHAISESTNILLDADMGVADFAVVRVKQEKIVDSTNYEMSI